MTTTEPERVAGQACLSDCGHYRYWLRREWGEGDSGPLFVMLNPSTADAMQDDPTIRRCKAFARTWGYSRMDVVNLFAYRATSPRDLLAAAEPIGYENDRHIRIHARVAPLIVAAWGAHGGHLGRGREVLRMLTNVGPVGAVHCLGMTTGGHPRHPLYVRGDTPLMELRGEEVA